MINPWLYIKCPESDANGRRVDPEHPLDFFWGKDYEAHYLLILQLPEGQEFEIQEYPDLRGIDVILSGKISEDSYHKFILKLRNQDDWEIFYSLCSDIINATRLCADVTIAIPVITQRLYHWQEFMKKNQNILLSEQQIRGLIGELLFLKNHLTPLFGLKQSLSFWQGPEGYPQDFNVNNSSIEIKTRLLNASATIIISSLDQLASTGDNLYLHVFCLSRSSSNHSGSFTLYHLVNDINSCLVAAPAEAARFDNLLYNIGYFHSEIYNEQYYLCAEEKTYQVSAGFPRITSADVSHGIITANYTIDLMACEKFACQQNWRH